MSISYAWLVVALAAAALLAVTIVVMRRGSVAGPPRVGDEPGAVRALTLVTLLGLSAWLIIPGFVAIGMRGAPGPTRAPATSPATAPAFTARQSVLISVIAGAGAAAVLVGANLIIRAGGLRRLGFSPDLLPRGFVVGFLASLIVLPLTFIAAVLTDKFWQLVGLEHPGVHELLEILGETQAPDLRALIYASAIVVAPLFEELLFRGHLQTLLVAAFTLKTSMATASADDPSNGAAREPVDQPVLDYAPPPTRVRPLPGVGVRWLAIVITSVLFALVHGAFWMMPPIFILSMCLGYVYERTGNLWTPITVHFFFNLANVTLFVSALGR